MTPRALPGPGNSAVRSFVSKFPGLRITSKNRGQRVKAVNRGPDQLSVTRLGMGKDLQPHSVWTASLLPSAWQQAVGSPLLKSTLQLTTLQGHDEEKQTQVSRHKLKYGTRPENRKLLFHMSSL